MKEPRDYRRDRSSGLWTRQGVGHCIIRKSMGDTTVISKRGLLDRGGQSEVLHHSKETMHNDYAVTTALSEAFSLSWQNQNKALRESLSNTESSLPWASQVAIVVKNTPANAGDTRDAGSISGSGRSPGGGHGSPLEYSCPENPMDRETWRATVHRQRVGHD